MWWTPKFRGNPTITRGCVRSKVAIGVSRGAATAKLCGTPSASKSLKISGAIIDPLHANAAVVCFALSYDLQSQHFFYAEDDYTHGERVNI